MLEVVAEKSDPSLDILLVLLESLRKFTFLVVHSSELITLQMPLPGYDFQSSFPFGNQTKMHRPLMHQQCLQFC
jgi:hypothetical protein